MIPTPGFLGLACPRGYLELRARPDEQFSGTVKRLGIEPLRERIDAAP
jgi:hypothetical protein